MPNEVPGKWCAEVLNKNLEVSKWRKVLPHQWHSPCCELDITAPALRGAPVKFGQNAGGVFLSEISKLLSGFLLFHLPLELCSWNINTFSYSLLVQGGIQHTTPMPGEPNVMYTRSNRTQPGSARCRDAIPCFAGSCVITPQFSEEKRSPGQEIVYTETVYVQL